ncbi:MAG: hypothetical protein JJT90_10625 [Ectothiorhodospiraceae bacterium]|nr:hypothetical protein [Ectothiorhodospiraceae bacterium]
MSAEALELDGPWWSFEPERSNKPIVRHEVLRAWTTTSAQTPSPEDFVDLTTFAEMTDNELIIQPLDQLILDAIDYTNKVGIIPIDEADEELVSSLMRKARERKRHTRRSLR